MAHAFAVPPSIVINGARVCILMMSASTLGGCGSLTVKVFSGTPIVLDIGGAQPTSPGQHIEMWGRNSNDDIIRISYLVNLGEPDQDEQNGLVIRPAIDPTDPCIIGDNGYLLTDPRAYPGTVTVGGVTQTPEEQAEVVIQRIHNVTSVAVGGLQATSLLLAMPYDGTPRPTIAASALPSDRFSACHQYWASGRYVYTPNPTQLAAPLHGVSFGPVNYTTAVPSQMFSEITLSSPYDLSNIREIWFTLESVPPDQVQPAQRGPVWLQSKPAADMGRGDLEFDLVGDNGLYGSIALILPRPASPF